MDPRHKDRPDLQPPEPVTREFLRKYGDSIGVSDVTPDEWDFVVTYWHGEQAKVAVLAYRDGRLDGYAAGYDDGYSEGYDEANYQQELSRDQD